MIYIQITCRGARLAYYLSAYLCLEERAVAEYEFMCRKLEQYIPWLQLHQQVNVRKLVCLPVLPVVEHGERLLVRMIFLEQEAAAYEGG